MRNLLSIPALALLLYGHFESKGMAAELNGRVIVTRKLTKKRVTLPVYQLRGMSPAVAASVVTDNTCGSFPPVGFDQVRCRARPDAEVTVVGTLNMD